MSWNKIKIISPVILFIVFVIFVKLTQEPPHSFSLSQQLSEDSLKETGAINVATGIYLDYRVYDSLFESLLLLVGAIGIHYLNKEDKYEDN